MADLETLTLRITEESSKAFSAIDKLAKRLDGLSVAVAKLEVGKLNDLASGLTNLNTAISLIRSNTKQADYTRIFKELSTLGNVDSTRLDTLSAALVNLSAAFQGMSGAASVTANVNELINSVNKLGHKTVAQAITNIPLLEQALGNLITSFSKLPTVNQSVIDFTDSLANLASQGQRIGSAGTTITNSLEKFGTAATRATRRTHSLASTIGTLYAKFWLLMRGARALKDSFLSAADYLEAFNYFDVTAKKIGKDTFAKAGVGSAEDYAEAFTTTLQEKLHKMSGLELDLEQRLIKTTNAKSLGLNLTELTQYQASIASITNAMGVSQEVAQSTAKVFSMLAGDMASLRNMDFSQVSQKLQAGLAGQARALYAFGVDITNATLEQYAYANGIEKSVSEMTQAEKAQLRLLAILDQSKVAWGDLANTINSPSNQLRMLKTNLKETATVFGQLFIPVMQSVLPVLNGLSMAIKQLMVDIATMLGIKLDLDSFGTFGDEVADDVESVDELNEAIKETKKGIRDFDELKVINDSSNKNSGLGAEIDLTKEILEATEEYEKVWDGAYARMTSKADEIAGYITNAFAPIKKIIQDFKIGNFFKAGTDISNLVKSIFDFVTKAINSVDWNALGEKVGNFLSGIDWTGILKSVGGLIGTALQAAINLWTGSFSVAPFETAVITAFALLKFTALGGTLEKTLIAGIKKLIPEKLKKINFAELGLGAVSVGLGISLTIDSIKKSKDTKGLQWMPLKTLVASAFTGAGLELAASAIGIASGGLMFSIGAAITLSIGLIGGIAAYDPTEAYNAARAVWKAEYDWVEENNLDRMQIITDIELKRGEIDTQFLQIDDLADKVYDLSLSYDSLTDGEKGLLKYYSDELIKVMPELASQIDEVTGAYNGSREALDELIKKQKEQIMVNAYEASLSELAAGMVSSKQDIKKLQTERDEVERQIADGFRIQFKRKMGDDYSEELWNYAMSYFDPKDKNKLFENFKGYSTDDTQYKYDKALLAIDSLYDSMVSTIARKDELDEQIRDTENNLATLESTYEDYANEIKRILGDVVPDNIKDGNTKAENELKKSKLPGVVKTTMDKVDSNINDGKTVASADMNAMFNAINEAFNGLDNGKVPREVQNTMAAVENAIRTNSPKLVELMQKLRQQLQDAFSNAVFDKNGEMIYNPNNIVGRMDDTIAKIQKAFANGAPLTGMEKNVEQELKELFGNKLPDSVSKSFASLKDAISKGYGVNEAIVALQKSVSKESGKLGWNVVFGIAGGIWDGTKIVAGAVEQMAQLGINDTFTDKEKISSPSKVMEDLAEYIPEGVALGIRNGIPKLEIAAAAMVSAINREFGDVKYNVPSIDYGMSNRQGYNYKAMDAENGFMSQMMRMANNSSQGQTEVVFRIEGDPHGMFKIIREQNDSYKKQNHRSAFI